MNNIYVDELPKRCNECKFQIFIAYHKNGWEHKERFCSVMKNNYDCICSKEKCPLKPLTDRLAEERKKVIERIRDLAEIYTEPSSKGFDFDTYILTEENLINILDKAERGSYE